MEEKEFLEIIDFITQKTGIIPRDSHRTGILNYINKRIEEIKSSEHSDSVDYQKYIMLHPEEMIGLINNSTVNETYFFREEAQFELLRNKILPEIKAKNNGKVRIWSAASSTGEEIYSLYLLSKSAGLECECIASDINTAVLDVCAQGVYRKKAARTVDGAKFQHLLNNFKQDDGGFVIPQEICQSVQRRKINLSRLEDFPTNQDIVFIRNVFIYFSAETKKQILQKLANTVLSDGGYIFVSMNEVASIEASIIPKELEKLVDGKVFYFHKKVLE